MTLSQGVTPRGNRPINKFVGKMVKRKILWVKWLIFCDKLHVFVKGFKKVIGKFFG